MLLNKEIVKIFDFTKYEEQILDCIPNAGLSISNISKETKIPRTSLLYILKKLQKRNLVSVVKNKKEKIWSNNVDKILNDFSQKKDIKESDQFSFNFGDSSVSFYKGQKNIWQIFEKWSSLPKNTRVYGIQPDKSLRQSLRKNSLENWLSGNEAVKRNKLIMEGIVHEKSINTIIAEVGKEKSQKIFKSFIGRLEDYVKIPDEFSDVESEMYIFGKTAYIINWNKEIAVEIRNQDMVDLFMAMFNCVKLVGTRYHQNKKMEEEIRVNKTAVL